MSINFFDILSMDIFRGKPTELLKPSPEMSLLFSCARTKIDEQMGQQIRAQVRAVTDWKKLRELAHHHRVMPLIYRSLYSTCPELVPKVAFLQLRRDYRANEARNLHLTSELLEILSIFMANGILAIPFKGPVLANAVYNDLSSRQYDDLDLMVDSKDLLKIKRLLLSSGYTQKEHFSEKEEQTHIEEQFELHFNKDGRVNLEVHWRITPKAFGNYLEFNILNFQEYQFSLGGKEVQVLRSKDRLQVLCLHATMHNWNRLGWVCDVAETVKFFDEKDWKAIAEIFRENNFERFLHLGLILAHELLQIKLPTNVRTWMLGDTTVLSVALKIRESFFQSSSLGLTALERFSHWLAMYKGLQSKLKAGYNLIAVPNTRDMEVLTFPSILSIFYLFLRPIRLWVKYTFRTKS